MALEKRRRAARAGWTSPHPAGTAQGAFMPLPCGPAINAFSGSNIAMIDDSMPPDDAPNDADVRISARTVRELLLQLIEIRAELDRVETRLRLALRKAGH